MSTARPTRGPKLPYRVLAGCVPTADGWLLMTGKLQGVTLLPEQVIVIEHLVDVLDYRPEFDVLAMHAPIGLLATAEPGGRACDRAARRLLGRARGASVYSPPSRAFVADPNGVDESLSGVGLQLFSHVSEVAREVGSYHQRRVFEVVPELSFYQLNDDVPMATSKRLKAGQDERRQLLERKLPGIDRVLDDRPPHVRVGRMLDAGACLWTARRIAARAIQRIPEDPEWDDEGIRMEIVR